jgi:hypothetical protein
MTLPERYPDGRLKPGFSGNPSGRPRAVRELAELAREHTPAALSRFVELMGSKNEAVALRAIELLFDRGRRKSRWGAGTVARRITPCGKSNWFSADLGTIEPWQNRNEI